MSETLNPENRQPSASRPTGSEPEADQSRRRKEGNDSLWKRAKRTLGASSLTFLQPESRSSIADKGGNGGASGKGPAAPSKRREQVRQAQRTHRQRTQNYIKTLESEVVRLRGSESGLMRQRDELQAQVEILKTTILLSNIPLPPGIDGSLTESSPTFNLNESEMASISYRMDDASHQRLHVDWMSPPTPNMSHMGQPVMNAHQVSISSSAGQDQDVGQTLTSLPNDFTLQQLNLAPYPRQTQQIPYANVGPRISEKLDSPEIAIEFVLALEHPCIAHLPHPTATPSDDPSNHILMASTPLISSAPQQPQPNTCWDWTANSSIIKELLNLSSSINLEGEITPVDAWHRLRQHPEFGRLDRHSLDDLKNELSAAVQCLGFGAVLDEALFQQAVERHLARAPNTSYAI